LQYARGALAWRRNLHCSWVAELHVAANITRLRRIARIRKDAFSIRAIREIRANAF
jgi:hypothetical protein